MAARVLFVLTSHSQLGDTGESTGYWVAEAAHPWRVMMETQNLVDVVSIAGGVPPETGLDASDDVQTEFLNNDHIKAQLASTKSIADVNIADYDAIHLVGGHGAVWDFPDCEPLQERIRALYENGGVVSAICHGPAGLVNVTLSDGSYLVDGKQMAGFTNSEEKAKGLTDVVPFLLQDKLEERGATVDAAADWQSRVVRDGQLITGQNPASGYELGKTLAAALDVLADAGMDPEFA